MIKQQVSCKDEIRQQVRKGQDKRGGERKGRKG